MPVEHLVFHPSKESLHDAIVVTVALSRHGLNDFVIFKCLPEVHVLVLPPLIRVKNQAIYRGKLRKGAGQHSLDLFHIGTLR